MGILSSGYKRKKPLSAAVYFDKQRTRVTHKSDVFLRQSTMCINTSSSSHRSGGHHSGGGGHHSSSHSSHGGGGGRRR